MPDDATRQALADQLLALPTPELIDVLQRVLPTHASSHLGIARRLVLAEISWEADKLKSRQDWDVAAVAWPDRDYYGGGFGPEPELWESGGCTGCGVEVVSTAKRAACPVCGTPCQLT